MDDLRPWQRRLQNYALEPALYIAVSPRLGKTRGELRCMRRRVEECGVRRQLVVGPKTPLLVTWLDELALAGYGRPRDGGGPAGYVVPLVDLAGKRTAGAAEIMRELAAGAAKDFSVIVLVNYDLLDRFVSKSVRLSDLIARWGPEDIVADEAHEIKSPSSQRSRALDRLGRNARFRRLLSGTPDPQSPLDFYAQMRFLDRAALGSNKQRVVEQYFATNPWIRGQVTGFASDEKRRAYYARIEPYMFRHRAEDEYGVDPETETLRVIPWPDAARKLYAELANERVLATEADGIMIDGTHTLTRLLRFLQLACGYLVDEACAELRWLHSAKHEMVISDLAEPLAAGERVVVSHLFSPDGAALVEAIGKTYGAQSVLAVNGSTKDTVTRLKLFDATCTTETPVRVLVVQEQTGGVGISLARANHLIFSSWSMNAADHEQMRKRIYAPPRVANYTYMMMDRSADQFAHKIVRNKSLASIMSPRFDLNAAIQGKANLL
jgi:hypothetical protein